MLNQMINWNPEQSANMVKNKLQLFNKVGLDIVQEIYKAQMLFNGKGNNQYSIVHTCTIHSFETYCSFIGLSKRTAYSWLERYIPEENKLLTYEEYQEIKKIESSQKTKQIIKENIKKNIGNINIEANDKEVENYINEKEKENKIIDEEKKNKPNIDEVLFKYQQNEYLKNDYIKKIISNSTDLNIFIEIIDIGLQVLNSSNLKHEAVNIMLKHLRQIGIEFQKESVNNNG